eukprot:gnl/MRDRNA2_/MRDRNA2_179508_c0_seq1.p1 gnl/MRDRNA2_/MRDRNA2_179508_c0~~gnl/MRDRNA2_/MRDRNA2_179508_c0_seq1.p1  ORF type:complete len:365 (+),score=75.17 gnl/MRDRNA2_/MRDRNA2_179508_c0_seq1:47-1096(+)
MAEQITGVTAGAAPCTAQQTSMAACDMPGMDAEGVSVSYASPAREVHSRGKPDSAIVCANPICVKVTGLQMCSCKKVWYCGKDCQKKHWKTHKAACTGSEKVAPEPEAVRVSSIVQLRNLQQAPELNGRRGEVIGRDDKSGRWCVKLFGTGEIKKVTDFKLFVVAADLPKDDPALNLVEKQESEFNNWGNTIMSTLRRILREDKDPRSGRTFLETFEPRWREWNIKRRRMFLQAVLAKATAAGKPEYQVWSAMASAQLSNITFVNKASPFLHWLSSALDGEVDTSKMREAAGMKSSLSGEDEFNLGVQEYKGHPKRLEYDLRIFAAFCRMFNAMIVQAFFDEAIDVIDE